MRRTIASATTVRGPAVHAGDVVEVVLQPAAPGAGIAFQRSDLPGSAAIAARWDRIDAVANQTVLRGEDGATIATVEHLLAACAAWEIDDLAIACGGPELPILDGSAAVWAQALEAAGFAQRPGVRRRVRVLRTVAVVDGAKRARLSPADVPSLAAVIRFADPAIGVQHFACPWTPQALRQDIVPARTFGFMGDLERLHAAGLAKGASLDNTIAVQDGRVLNPQGLRFPDEFVRHKLLDVVGDLALAGGPILAAYEADQPGHALNAALLRALFADEAAFRWETIEP